MKKSLLLLLIVVFLLILSSCFNDDRTSVLPVEPMETFQINVEHIGERDSFMSLINKSIIGVDYDARLRNEYSIYRYYFETNERVDIGVIQNFSMTYGRPVVSNDFLYLFVAAYENNIIVNNLYSINLKTNEMEILFTNDNSITVTPVSTMSGNLYFLGTNTNVEENTIYSHISKLDDETKQPLSVINKYKYDPNIGDIFVNFAAYNDELYVLTMVKENNETIYVVDIYDISYNLTKRLYLDETLGDIQTDQRITKFYVVDGYVFIRTTGQGLLGKIDDTKIVSVLVDPGLDMAFNAFNNFEENCIFYVMRTNIHYVLNLKNNTLVEKEWVYDDTRVISYILSDNEGYIIHNYIPEKSGLMLSPEIVYAEW